MAGMVTRDGRWRIEVGGTGTAVVWYRLIGPDVDRWLPSTPALIAELARHAVGLADLRVEIPDLEAALLSLLDNSVPMGATS